MIRPGAGVNYTVPVTTGGWGQLSYYITDKVYVNGLYGYNRNYESAHVPSDLSEPDPPVAAVHRAT